MVGVRDFSTSSAAAARTYKSVVNRQLKKVVTYAEGDVKPWYLRIPKEKAKYPPYPYGEARIFKRGDRGLFGGSVVGTGHQISEMRNKSQRTWLPNVIHKKLWSEALNKMVPMRLTARVLRTVNKEGGLDEYLTKDKSARVKELGLFGWKLRCDVLKAREAAGKPANYELAEAGKKVYYSGEYKGELVQLTVGRRALLQLLFPKVKYETPGELKFGQFSTERSQASFQTLLTECEKYDVDLSAVRL